LKVPAALKFLKPAAACLAFVVLILCAVSASGKTVNKVVAVVNGEVVTLYDLKSQLEASQGALDMASGGDELGLEGPALRKRVLEAMINDILLLQEAERLGIEVPKSIVEKRIERIKKEESLTDQEFDELLAEEGLTRSEYVQKVREGIKKNRLLQSMVRDKVLVTEEEIKAYYQEHIKRYEMPEKLRLKILVMSDQEELSRIKQRIREGTLSFGQAAEQFSEGPAASQGGDLGLLRWRDLQERWRQVLAGLKPGQMSPVFQVGEQSAVLLLDEVQSGNPLDLEKVHDRIRDRLQAQKLRSRYDEYISDLRSKAVIDVRL